MVPLYYQYFVQYWLVVRGDHDFDPGVMPPSFEEARRLLSWFTSDDFARRRMRSVLADDFHCHDLFRYDDNQVLDMLAQHIACGRAQIYKEEMERPALSPALPAKPPEKPKEVQAKEQTTWIEVLLVDEADKPVPGRPYRVAKVGGKPIGSGSLDSQGFVRLDTRLFGECVIQFPDIDQSAIRESYKTSPPPPSKPKPAPQEQSADTEESEIDDTDLLDEDLIKSFWEDEEPAVEEEESQPEGMTESAGDGNHVVQQGECLASIAYETGFLPDTIWKHGRNKALREVRKDPNALLPGDRLAIPPLQPAQFRGTTGARHRYVLIDESVPGIVDKWTAATHMATTVYDERVEKRVSLPQLINQCRVSRKTFLSGNHDNYLRKLSGIAPGGLPKRSVGYLADGIHMEHGHMGDPWNRDGVGRGHAVTNLVFLRGIIRKGDPPRRDQYLRYGTYKTVMKGAGVGMFVMAHTHKPFMAPVYVRT